MKNRVIESPFFSLQLHGSTDVEGLCQLLVFVRYIWNAEPHEDKLLCEPSVEVSTKKFLILLILISERKVLIGINA